MFSLLMTFLTTRNNNTRRFHSILNTFRFFLLIRGSPQKTLIFLVVKIKIVSPLQKFSSLDSSFVVLLTEDKNTNHGINVSAREDRSVRRLFDATRDRTRRMGREFGTSSRVYIHFLFLFVYYYALYVLFLCVSVLVFFILEFDRRAP